MRRGDQFHLDAVVAAFRTLAFVGVVEVGLSVRSTGALALKQLPALAATENPGQQVTASGGTVSLGSVVIDGHDFLNPVEDAFLDDWPPRRRGFLPF